MCSKVCSLFIGKGNHSKGLGHVKKISLIRNDDILSIFDRPHPVLLRMGGGVARVVNEGSQAIRSLAKYTLCVFSLSSIFLRNVPWPVGLSHSQVSLYTRDKQIFHVIILLMIYRRAFSSKSLLLPVHRKAWSERKGALSKIS